MQRSAYSESQYLENYPEGIENHFWNLARNRLISATLRRALPAPGRMLDIGCGPAIVLRHLREEGFDCWGCEVGVPNVPEAMRPFVYTQQDCFQLDPEIRRGIDAVLLFDVLEHIEHDVQFLRKIAEGFPNSRALVMTVPARAELWSNYDEHYGHFRRYGRSDLAAVLGQAGFTLLNSRYFFHELYIPALFLTRILKRREVKLQAPKGKNLHRLIAWGSGICTAILPPGLPGLSLIAVAKPGSAR